MFIGFNLHRGTVAIDKIILRPGKVPASFYQKNNGGGGGGGDTEPESDSDDDKDKNDQKSCEEKGNCKKE
jgi:hypothetical protein